MDCFENSGHGFIIRRGQRGGGVADTGWQRYNDRVSVPFGPSLDRALALVGLPGELRSQLGIAKESGYRGVQLNAAAAGVRPRELDRSARRDIGAMLTRHDLVLSGVDLWIPPEHFTEPESADRAMSALGEAIRFAAEMGVLCGSGGVVSCGLPKDEAVRSFAEQQAAAAGCIVADHSWPLDSVREAESAIRAGIDPAVVLAAEGVGKGIGRLIAGVGAVASARLSDLDGSGRVEAGKGSLDQMSYEATLVTVGYAGLLVVDMRGLPDPLASAGRLAG